MALPAEFVFICTGINSMMKYTRLIMKIHTSPVCSIDVTIEPFETNFHFEALVNRF